MKLVLFLLLLNTACLYAQESQPPGPPGCGPAQEKFDVIATKSSTAVQPDPDKALIYVIQDDSHFESRPRPTTRVGVDGKWVGATHSNSYLRVLLDPGEHHLCASWQGFVGIGAGLKVAALHFTAESGKSYYFRVKDKWLRDHGPAEIEFALIDSDEGQLLASKFALSTSHPKK